MNFVFIIDTSLSMSQTFDNISFFDYAKSSIRKFVLDREMNNNKLNRGSDKYFLVSLNQNICDNYLYNWSTTTNHFLYQLNALKISYDFTDIGFAIKKSFQMINFIKKIGYERHIYGRLFSQIGNSYIILITDGGCLSSSEKVLSLNNCNLSTLDLKDQNEFIIDNYPNIYKELYRWDQCLYAIVLTDKKNDFESYHVLDRIFKNVRGKIITVNNPSLLNDKLSDLSNKEFQNNRVFINFNINKKKKINNITYLEYNDSTDKMNEKWPFPDELIINKENTFLPKKNALPFYEFGKIDYNLVLTPEYYDEYDIKDKKFIFNVLTEGDCWDNLTLINFIKSYKTSLTIDILVSNLTDKIIMKKPFGVIIMIFSKELINLMKDIVNTNENITFTKFFTNFQNIYTNNNYGIKMSNISNYIKCSFYNLPYNYTEFLSLIEKYKSRKIIDAEQNEFQYNLEKYFGVIPIYYIKYIIYFLEKNKIKKFCDKYKESIDNKINENFNKNLCKEIQILYNLETSQILNIKKLFRNNQHNHTERKANCCSKKEIYNNKYSYHVNEKKDESEEDIEYNNFLEKSFKVDKINNMSKLNYMNRNNNLYNVDLVQNIRKNSNDDSHESDIDIMGYCKNYYYKSDHLKSYLIPEIEIRYLINDFFYGNHFLERKNIYTSKQINNNSSDRESMKDESLFLCLNKEDNNKYYNIGVNNNKTTNNANNNLASIKKTNSINSNSDSSSLEEQINKKISEQVKNKEMEDKINNDYLNNKRKRERENSMDTIDSFNLNISETLSKFKSSSPESSPNSFIISDNFSESDGSNNLLLNELSDNKYISKMSNLLIEEFKDSISSENNGQKDGIKISVKYDISKEKLNKWIFQKNIKSLSQELINSIHNDEKSIIKVINKIINQNNFSPDKQLIYNFIEKTLYICQSYGVNSMIQIQLQKLMKSYS